MRLAAFRNPSFPLRYTTLRMRRPALRSLSRSLPALAVTLLLLFASPTSAADGPRTAGPGDMSLRVLSLVPADGTISAHEPLLAQLKLTNQTAEELRFLRWSMRLEVYDQDGQLLGATPREPLPIDLLLSGPRVPARGSLTRWVVLSALYPLTKPGRYSLRVQQLIPSEGLPVLAEATTQVLVLPFDSPRLRARCEELFAPWRGFGRNHSMVPANPDAFPVTLRLKALYSIRHDAALPYLSLIAGDWGRTSLRWPAMMAIRRIDTPRSTEVFTALTSRRDDVGRVARMVAEQRLDEIDDWCVGPAWEVEGPVSDGD